MIQIRSAISADSNRTVTFVRERGRKSILDDYSHLTAFGSWEIAGGSFVTLQKQVSNSCDKYYTLRIRKAENGQTLWINTSTWNWFDSPSGITVDRNGRFLKTKLLGVEIATLEKPVAFNAYGPSQLLG